jgi:hypothetical protein
MVLEKTSASKGRLLSWTRGLANGRIKNIIFRSAAFADEGKRKSGTQPYVFENDKLLKSSSAIFLYSPAGKHSKNL